MKNLASRRPFDEEWSMPYHGQLIDIVHGECAISALHDQMYWICELASSLSTEQVDKTHTPYTWTIRQVFEHCANAERVFGYRMLRFAAGDKTDLPSWDENAYADARFGLGNFVHIVTELGSLRKSNVMLLRRINPATWDQVATVDGEPISMRAIAWITAGHLHHHLQIIEKRCGVSVDRTSPERYNEIKDQIEHMENVLMPQLLQKLASAREKGNLVENAEYHRHREAQGVMHARINELKSMLSKATNMDVSEDD